MPQNLKMVEGEEILFFKENNYTVRHEYVTGYYKADSPYYLRFYQQKLELVRNITIIKIVILIPSSN